MAVPAGRQAGMKIRAGSEGTLGMQAGSADQACR
jgi:hypothetical protein